MQSLDIQGFTYEQRHGLLPVLTPAFGICGGWVLDRRSLSPTDMEFRLEIQLRGVLDLYAALASRPASNSLARATTLSPRYAPRLSHARRTGTLGQVVAIRLEISFLDDVTLHSLLASSGGDRAWNLRARGVCGW